MTSPVPQTGVLSKKHRILDQFADKTHIPADKRQKLADKLLIPADKIMKPADKGKK
jgi:hypothetical protein